MISKKDLLKKMNISYGQLYRWKREELIPDHWFMKLSVSSGQETFFEEELIIPRISKILELKDKYSLEEFRCESNNINLDQYIEFRENVSSKMEIPEWLGEIPKEGLEEMLSIGGKIWMYYMGDIPVCTWMFIPAGEEAKEDLEIEGIDYNLMGDIGPVFVNFDFLGNGLMYQMLLKFDEYLKSIGYKYVMTTVHPENKFSSSNMIKYGMNKVSQKVFKRGPRDIYFKELD